MGRKGVQGIVIPISEEPEMHNVFHGRSVYAGLSKRDEGTDLEKGDRIFFYDSGKTHRLIGEAVITSISFSKARDVGEFGDKLFMDEDSLERYISSLPEGKESTLRIISFEEPTVYADPVKCGIEIPERGLHMTADIFARIKSENA